ncbi:RDD family protein [Solwaraspora sp. WMMD406]|uniref:RDD family protein n=1 Tax=Solwaraspora sp. WMMD406 TaxID=3016095 RepID=UPI00241649D5|nr:RDD family protein [Solwaraspora sp. WMMD406]MDG4765102.1 RDD family protein [Solwaraspora sp. WMMD406]
MSDSASGATATGPAPASDPPGLARRTGALVIDWLLCVLVAGLFADPARDGWPPVLVLVVEYAIFLGLFAQTPGMWLARIRCVSDIDGGRIGVPRALVRGILLALVVPPLIMDDRRRGLHDRAAGSVVVAVNR